MSPMEGWEPFNGEWGRGQADLPAKMEVLKAGCSCDPFFLDFPLTLQRHWTEISPSDDAVEALGEGAGGGWAGTLRIDAVFCCRPADFLERLEQKLSFQ